jgi:hypothetical protein
MEEDDARALGRIEAKLEVHITSEELLLKTILKQIQAMTEKLTQIREQLATHGERSANQHQRIRRAESLILWGGGAFGTIFTGLIVALLTGAL